MNKMNCFRGFRFLLILSCGILAITNKQTNKKAEDFGFSVIEKQEIIVINVSRITFGWMLANSPCPVEWISWSICYCQADYARVIYCLSGDLILLLFTPTIWPHPCASIIWLDFKIPSNFFSGSPICCRTVTYEHPILMLHNVTVLPSPPLFFCF